MTHHTQYLHRVIFVTYPTPKNGNHGFTNPRWHYYDSLTGTVTACTSTTTSLLPTRNGHGALALPYAKPDLTWYYKHGTDIGHYGQVRGHLLRSFTRSTPHGTGSGSLSKGTHEKPLCCTTMFFSHFSFESNNLAYRHSTARLTMDAPVA